MSPTRSAKRSTTPCCPTSRATISSVAGRAGAGRWAMPAASWPWGLISCRLHPARPHRRRLDKAQGRAGADHLGAAAGRLVHPVRAAIASGHPRHSPAAASAFRAKASATASPCCWRPSRMSGATPISGASCWPGSIYNDGLNTLFAFGGIYAAGTFGMSPHRGSAVRHCPQRHRRLGRLRLCLHGRQSGFQADDLDRHRRPVRRR